MVEPDSTRVTFVDSQPAPAGITVAGRMGSFSAPVKTGAFVRDVHGDAVGPQACCKSYHSGPVLRRAMHHGIRESLAAEQLRREHVGP